VKYEWGCYDGLDADRKDDPKIYWHEQWGLTDDTALRVPPRFIYIFLMRVDERFYISSNSWKDEDIGPFPTFDDARIAAETIMDLNEWPFKRKEET
jgi:hypothetical protein